jgi:hypothetical protein
MMKLLKRLDPTWWRKVTDGYDQQDGRARLVRMKTGDKVTGWALYVDGECVGSWPSLGEAKERAATFTETWTQAQQRLESTPRE